jgi:serine/threonine protein kinase
MRYTPLPPPQPPQPPQEMRYTPLPQPPQQARYVPPPLLPPDPDVGYVPRAAGFSATEIYATTPSASAPSAFQISAYPTPPVSSSSGNFVASTGPQTNPSRITVLPRVEIVGSEPKLVVQGKRRYENFRPLGKGGIGEVVSVQDNDIGRPVALKRLRRDMQSPSALARFVDEIRTTGGLEHPNIVPIHDVGLDEEGHYYFVMKFVGGETLESIIAKLAVGDPDYHRRYTFERRVQLFLGILDAVGFAHERGIIHRDLKPSNVMVGVHGEVLVMDWGIAKSLREPLQGEKIAAYLPPSITRAAHAGRGVETQAGTLIGTPAYMSPEQAMGAVLDERSDIYSLCVLFHELLSLRHYLADKATVNDMLTGVIQQKTSLPLHLQKTNPFQGSVPADLAWYVHRGLEKDPNKRYMSVKEMQYCLVMRAEGCIRVQCLSTLLKRMINEFGRMADRYPILMPTLVFGGGLLAIVLVIRRVFFA